MHRLRSANKLALPSRLLLSRSPALSAVVEPQCDLPRPGAKKRRFFSDVTATKLHAPSASIPDKTVAERTLEEYTSYALRAHRVPLGTLTAEEWDDSMAAFVTWTTEMGMQGYAIDSAERLMQRIQYEISVLSDSAPDYKNRLNMLVEMRKNVLLCWLKLHERHPSSIMALDRSERALWNILQHDLIGDASSFPVKETFQLIDGFLDNKTPQAVQRAASLLLSLTADPYITYLADHVSELSTRFDKIISAILSSFDHNVSNMISTRLLDRMTFLRNELSWAEMELSPSTLLALEDAAFQKIIEESETNNIVDTTEQTARTVTAMSSFEAAAMQKRMTKMIREAKIDDHENIANIIQRVQEIENIDEDLIFSLADYYLRMGDVVNASTWTLRLPSSTIFSENASTNDDMPLIDRLLEKWALESHPRAPWRAEEIFRKVVDGLEEGNQLSVATMNRFLRIWSGSSDPAAKRKIREWFFHMTDSMGMKPDGTSIYTVLQALDENSSASETLFARVLDEWKSWNKIEKQAIADLLMDKFWDARKLSPFALSLLARFKGDHLDLSMERYPSLVRKASLSLEPDSVLETIEKLNVEAGIDDLMLYEVGIHSLIKSDRKYLALAIKLWKRAFEKVQSNPALVQSESFSTFLNGAMKLFTFHRHYNYGEALLDDAERVIFPLVPKTEGNTLSPIPLETYQRLMVRKWYRLETAEYVIQLYKRLENLYEQGYVNLRPNQEIMFGCLKATVVVSRDFADVERIFHQMIELYQEMEDDSSKPHAEAFNVILLCTSSMMSDAKSAKQKSLEIWNHLLRLKVIPNTKTINLVMQNVMRGNDSAAKSSYSEVTTLYKSLDEFHLEADSHTWHLLISACGSATSKEREDAMATCLKMLGEIRQHNATTVHTYASLTKSLRRLLRNVPVPIADKVGTSTWQLCCRDGLLAPEVKEAFQSIISKNIWKQIYLDRVEAEQQEPEEWCRNLPKANNKTS